MPTGVMRWSSWPRPVCPSSTSLWSKVWAGPCPPAPRRRKQSGGVVGREIDPDAAVALGGNIEFAHDRRHLAAREMQVHNSGRWIAESHPQRLQAQRRRQPARNQRHHRHAAEDAIGIGRRRKNTMAGRARHPVPQCCAGFCRSWAECGRSCGSCGVCRSGGTAPRRRCRWLRRAAECRCRSRRDRFQRLARAASWRGNARSRRSARRQQTPACFSHCSGDCRPAPATACRCPAQRLRLRDGGHQLR